MSNHDYLGSLGTHRYLRWGAFHPYEAEAVLLLRKLHGRLITFRARGQSLAGPQPRRRV